MVTGTSGEIGKALVNALLDKGAAKIYAARTPLFDTSATGHGSDKVTTVKLDITAAAEVAAAVRRCTDVDLIINSAGINRSTALSGTVGLSAAREEMEVNFFGALAMCLAFAPVLASRGGGVIVNVCSSVCLVNLPLQGIYRVSLAARNIRVIRAYPDLVAPPTSVGLQAGKTVVVPAMIAEAILSGVEKDLAGFHLITRPQHAPAGNQAVLQVAEQSAANG